MVRRNKKGRSSKSTVAEVGGPFHTQFDKAGHLEKRTVIVKLDWKDKISVPNML